MENKSCYLTEEELAPYQAIMDDLTMDEVRMASSLIDGYLGRSYAPTEYVDRVILNKKHRGKLKHAPVMEVKKVEAIQRSMFGRSRLEIPLEDVELDPERDGYFTFIGSCGLNGLIYGDTPKHFEITYLSGFGEYPDRLKQACGMLASNICQAKSFNGAKQLTSLDFQVLMTDDSFFTSDIKMLLKGLDSDVQLF
jgi:hypothetical protein